MADPATASDPVHDYWEHRHATGDDLASGGHIDIDRGGNEIYLARRLGELLTVLGDLSSTAEPFFVLDAGCGKGHVSRALARCGHRVDAFDLSEAAIGHCRAEGGGPRYAVADLAEWSSPWLYDAVLCLDVLFHLLDDARWQAGLRNLASLVRLTGTLVVGDADPPAREARGDYILHRPAAEYRAVLEPLGLRPHPFRPYRFRDGNVGFHVFTRAR